MDYETKIYLDNLIEAVDSPDWWGFGATVFVGIVAAGITWILGRRQNNLHKADIKLTLYDKRYQIYDAIVRTKYISDSKHMVRWELNQKVEESYVKTQLAEIHDEMYKASVVAKTVFPQPIALKIEKAYELFNLVILEHLQIVKNFDDITPEDMVKVREISGKLKDASSMSLLSEDNIDSTLELIKSFMILTKYSPLKYKKRKEYGEWLSESRILEEIQPYITIDTLDK